MGRKRGRIGGWTRDGVRGEKEYKGGAVVGLLGCITGFSPVSRCMQ